MTESKNRATFQPVPAWWVPVWVELQGDSDVPDPLEKAVHALVRAGRNDVAMMAADLCVPAVLVRSSVEMLVLHNKVRVDEAGRVHPAPETPTEGDEPQVKVREAWVAWDPIHRRPLTQIWVHTRYPSFGEVSRPPDDLRPSPEQLDTALRLLPHMDTLDLLIPRKVPRDEGAEAPRGFPRSQVIDNTQLRAIRLREAGRTRRGGMLVPTELRLGSAVVWRPTLRAHDESLGELDPLGVRGLQLREPDAAQAVRDALTDAADHQLGPLLEKAGYRSMEEVREAARREARSAIGAGWSKTAWPLTTLRIEEAHVEQRVGTLLSGDWRRLALGWAHVVEAFTQELVGAAMHIVLGCRSLPGIPGPDRQRLKRLLPSLSNKVLSDLEKPETGRRVLAELKKKLSNDSDSIGHRLATIAVAARVDTTFRKALFDANDHLPDVMKHLDAAAQERNTVMHEKRSGEEVDVHGLRERVVRVCRAWMDTELRPGA